MVGALVLLPEQCEPFCEFLAIVKHTQEELHNPRAMEYYGRGVFTKDLVENHSYVLEELLYPLIDKCNPSQLYVVVTPFHVEVQLK